MGTLPLKVRNGSKNLRQRGGVCMASASLDLVSLDSKTVGESPRAAEWEAAGRAAAVFTNVLDPRSSG